MHPAVKSMLGKKPIAKMQMSTPSLPSGESSSIKKNISMNDYGTLKIPRYIPPTLPEQLVAAPVRGELHCTKKKLIIGNISRWIPVSERDDTASHKWMVCIISKILLSCNINCNIITIFIKIVIVAYTVFKS